MHTKVTYYIVQFTGQILRDERRVAAGRGTEMSVGSKRNVLVQREQPM